MVTKDAEIDEIAQRILLELESASSKDLSDVHYAHARDCYTILLRFPIKNRCFSLSAHADRHFGDHYP